MVQDTPLYRPGDPPPRGYMAWHAWAAVQQAAGLRQRRCGGCDRWNYPQELDAAGRCQECAAAVAANRAHGTEG